MQFHPICVVQRSMSVNTQVCWCLHTRMVLNACTVELLTVSSQHLHRWTILSCKCSLQGGPLALERTDGRCHGTCGSAPRSLPFRHTSQIASTFALELFPCLVAANVSCVLNHRKRKMSVEPQQRQLNKIQINTATLQCSFMAGTGQERLQNRCQSTKTASSVGLAT